MSAEAMAFTAGSNALTTCVKETATAPREATVATWPAEKAAPTGASLRRSLFVTLGTCTRPLAHMSMAIGTPTASWIQETAQVASKQLRSFLFSMLYCTLKKYQSPTKITSLLLSKSCLRALGFSSASGSDAALAAARAVAARTIGRDASMEAVGATATPGRWAEPVKGRLSAGGCCCRAWTCCRGTARRPAGGAWNAWPRPPLRVRTAASATSAASVAGRSTGLARAAAL
mmetsp:Transcript_97920/g.292514  ORF Transcript_97920/g.292514 Transcript_97920/m.292514 type:complete len:231 (+) Transcript_97920:921-1613(+)